MTDSGGFLTSQDIKDELRAQGRVFFTDGSWSPQGFADEEHGVDPSEIRYNDYWPLGELNSDWTPCDMIKGGGCKPYGNGEIESKLREWDDEVGGMIFTELGEWAPKIIQNLVEMGLDMGIWNVNSPGVSLVTMCSKCGCCIVKTLEDWTGLGVNVETSEWSSFFG